MRRLKLALLVFILIVATGSAQAGVKFSFTPDGSAINFNVLVGASVNVPVYLVDTDGMTTLATDGLIAVGNRLTYDTAPGSATVISATINPQFGVQMVLDGGTNFSRINNTAGTADIAGTLLLDPAIQASSILVGTYSFFGNAVGVTNVNTGIPVDPGVLNYNVTNPGATLDSTITNMSTTITTAIPEPSSLILMGLVCGIGGLSSLLNKFKAKRG